MPLCEEITNSVQAINCVQVEVLCWINFQLHVWELFTNSQIQEYKNTESLCWISFQLHVRGLFANTQLYKYTNINTQIYKYTIIQIHNYTNIQIHKHKIQRCLNSFSMPGGCYARWGFFLLVTTLLAAAHICLLQFSQNLKYTKYKNTNTVFNFLWCTSVCYNFYKSWNTKIQIQFSIFFGALHFPRCFNQPC